MNYGSTRWPFLSTRECPEPDRGKAMADMLGIRQIAVLHRFTRSLAADCRFFGDVLSFEQIAVSSEALERQLRQRSVLFRAGSCFIVCTEPVTRDSAAGRYLQLHPDGIGAVAFDV